MKTKNNFTKKCKATATFIFAAIMTLSFSACFEEDNPVVIPETLLTDQIYGTWWAIYPDEGTVGTGDLAQAYDHVGQASATTYASTVDAIMDE